MNMECSTTSSHGLTMDSTMDDNQLEESFLQKEYVTQYLGFTPNSFINGVYNAMITYIDEGIRSLGEYILKQYSGVMTANQQQESSQILMSRMATELDKSFDTLQIYLTKNVFDIPPHVVLPQDLSLTEEACLYTEEDEKNLDDELQQLKNKILAIRYANVKLQQEMETINCLQTKLDATLTKLRDLNKISTEAGVPDNKECVIHTKSSIVEQINMFESGFKGE